jgi:hypothetical protein
MDCCDHRIWWQFNYQMSIYLLMAFERQVVIHSGAAEMLTMEWVSGEEGCGKVVEKRVLRLHCFLDLTNIRLKPEMEKLVEEVGQ